MGNLDTNQSNNRFNVHYHSSSWVYYWQNIVTKSGIKNTVDFIYSNSISAYYFVLLVYFFVQVARYLFEVPWYDESFTTWLINLSWTSFFNALAGDVHPPLYYILAKIAGGSLLSARLISLISVLISILIFKHILHSLKIEHSTMRIALTIIFVSPYSIQYATEARMYGLLMLFCLLSAYLAINGHSNVLMLAFVGGIYTHNLFALYIPVYLIILFTRKLFTRKQIKPLVLILAIVLYSPWLPVAVYQLLAVREAFWVLPLSLGKIFMIINNLIWGRQSMIIMSVGGILTFSFLTIAPKDKTLWALGFGPLIIGVLLSVIIKPILIARVLIGSAPFVFIIIAQGIKTLSNHWGKGYTIAFIIPAVFVMIFQMSPPKQNPAITAIVDGGTCYHISTGTLIELKHLLNCNHVALPTKNNLNEGLSDKTKTSMGINEVDFNSLGSGKVWVIWAETPYSHINEYLTVKFILAQYHPQQKYTLNDSSFLKETVWLIEK